MVFCSGSNRAREAELEKLEEEDDEEGVEEGTKSSSAAVAGNKAGGSQNVARHFRYMRRKPTIISYKPPEGEFSR